eukprot:UN13282
MNIEQSICPYPILMVKHTTQSREYRLHSIAPHSMGSSLLHNAIYDYINHTSLIMFNLTLLSSLCAEKKGLPMQLINF